MDNELPATDHTEAAAPAMPRAAAFAPTATGANQDVAPYAEPATPIDEKVRTGVFASLVQSDADIAGLVAYSIYKQHKLDWLRAFEKTHGRTPDEAEMSSYLIGEGTPRRIATYRHLAESTLAGHGPSEPGHGAGRFRTAAPGERRALAPGMVVAYAIIAVLFAVGFWFALHYTVASR